MPQAPYFKLITTNGHMAIVSLSSIKAVVFEPSNGITTISFGAGTFVEVAGYDAFDYIDKMLQLETILIDFAQLKELAPALDKLIAFNQESDSPTHSIIHILKNVDDVIEKVRTARERTKATGSDIQQLAFEFDQSVN